MVTRGVATPGRRDAVPLDLDALLDLAEQARLRGDYREGADHARRAVELAEELDDPPGVARSLRSLSMQLVRLGEYERSVAASRDAIAILEALGDDDGVCWELTGLALSLKELGLFDEALEGLARARQIAVRRRDTALLYWVHNRTGVVHSSMGNYEQGNTYLLRALELAADMDAEARFCILNNLADNAVGLVPQLRGRARDDEAGAILDTALEHSSQALALAREAEHPFRVSICLDNQGMLLGLAGRHDDAVAAITESLGVAVARGYRALESSALQHLARLHRLRGEFAEAIGGLNEALRRFEQTGEKLLAMTAHEQLCEAYEQVGDFRSALSHYRSYHALEREARSDVAAVRARLMIHHFELDNARLEADNARLEAELHRIRSSELEADKRALEVQARQLDRYAHEDALTGLANRRWVDLRLPELMADPRAHPLCLAIADVDRFKGVNDSFGHAVGDQVLRRMAMLLRAGLRAGDLVARFGGEEFVIAFVGVDVAEAHRRCERLRAGVARFDWSVLGDGLRVTLSFGVAQHDGDANPGALLGRADAALYRAKNSGRNRVESEVFPRRDRGNGARG